MTKKAIKGKEARKRLMAGVELVAEAVAPTLGPSARFVMLERPYGSPLTINDGVTITKDIESDDPYEMMGIRLVQEVAANAQENGGDGTTTATLLAHSLCKNGLELLEQGHNPMDVKNAFDAMLESCEEWIDDFVIAPEDEKDKHQQILEVATVAANNDPVLGALIAEALHKTQYEGIITVEESHTTKHDFKIVEGLEIDSGFASPYLINEQGRMESVLENVHVHLSKDILTQNDQIVPAMEAALGDQKALLILAKGIEGEALQTLITNVQRGVMRACAVVIPPFHFDDVVLDLEALLGEDRAVGKVIVGKNYTRIIGSKGDVSERCEVLAEQVKQADQNGEGEFG